MRRRVFDLLVSAGGAMLVVVLVVAGALLMWAYSFAQTNVHNQLALQQIRFPTAAQMAQAKPDTEITPGMLPYIRQYAGQEVLNGAQAEAYADHFIAVHLYDMPLHGVYANVSAAAMAAQKAAPGSANATTLATEVQTVFRGTTLRGLLLEAYGYWKFGQIALVSAIVSFCLAFVMALLVGFGFWHARRTPADADLLGTVGGGRSLQKTA